MGSWHAFRTLILLILFFLYETTLGGVAQGDAHVTHDWGKSIDPAESNLKWIGWLHLRLLGRTVGSGDAEWVKQRAPGRIPSLLKNYVLVLVGWLSWGALVVGLRPFVASGLFEALASIISIHIISRCSTSLIKWQKQCQWLIHLELAAAAI